MSNIDAREVADGLRRLADMIEANPELVAPLGVGLRNIGSHVFADEAPEIFAAFARAAKAHGAPVTKDYSDKFASVTATFGAVQAFLQADREQVCERVVTGVETVTTLVPDPDAPLVEVTETRETFRWDCKPILNVVAGDEG